jgi:hypothetical protein
LATFCLEFRSQFLDINTTLVLLLKYVFVVFLPSTEQLRGAIMIPCALTLLPNGRSFGQQEEAPQKIVIG